MVASINHETSTPRGARLSTCNGRRRKLRPASELRPARSPRSLEPAARQSPPHNGEGPQPQELPRAIDRGPEPRRRERSAYDGDNSFTLYLREIGQVKLLTPQEEIALAARIKKGDKQAREQMITANLRLVVKIARDYEGVGLPLLDLVSEGNIGLMKAVDRFDPAKGGKLSTYSAWWIKQSIKRVLAAQSKTNRLASPPRR